MVTLFNFSKEGQIVIEAKMTKLMEWLFVLSVFLVAYIAIITKQIESGILDNWMFEIKIAPVFLILMFGVNMRNCNLCIRYY